VIYHICVALYAIVYLGVCYIAYRTRVRCFAGVGRGALYRRRQKGIVVSCIGGLCSIVIDGLNGFVCDLTPESLAHGIRRALEARRLPTGQTLELFRSNMGKPRWERQVWQRLSRWLELE